MPSFFRSPWFLLPLLAVVIRFFSFFPLVIDHDESTYLVIARELLLGKLYFKDVIDTKPIGIFWIYSFLELVTGKSIFWIRFLTALIAGWTAVSLYKFNLNWTHNIKSAWAAGIIYLILISVFKRWGLSPNTELFFNLLTILSFNLLLNDNKPITSVFSGLLFGLGFIIKYVILADVFAMTLYILALAYLSKNLISNGLLKLIYILTGFLIPIAFVIIYYYQKNALDLLSYYSIHVTSRYPSHSTLKNILIFNGDFILRYLPFVIMAAWTLKSDNRSISKYKFLFVVWMAMDLIIITLPGKNFEHYFIQLYIPISLLAGAFFSINPGIIWIQKVSKVKQILISCLLLSAILFFQKKSYYDKKETVLEVQLYLKNELKPRESIYTGNYQHILYYTLGLSSPTPYIHSSLLWNPEHIQALEINLEKEADKILLSRPRFIILQDPVPQNILYEKIKARYSQIKTFKNGINILELLN